MSIAGIALLLLGLFLLLIRGGSFTTQRDVVKVGDVKLTATSASRFRRGRRGSGSSRRRAVDRRDAPARLRRVRRLVCHVNWLKEAHTCWKPSR